MAAMQVGGCALEAASIVGNTVRCGRPASTDWMPI